MTVDPATAKHRAEHAGQSYFFCSGSCKAKFEAQPEKFLGGHREAMGDPVAAADVPAGTKWICPMDPEVESDKPGACPVCGMALEPELVTVEEGCTMGGAGSAVLECLAAAGLAVPVLQLGLPDKFVEHGDPARLLALCGLDAAGIEASIRQRFGSRPSLAAVNA